MRAPVVAARAALAALALALVAGAGCGKSRTEAVVVVTASGLRVPDDIDAVHVQVFDAENTTPSLWDVTYTLCTDTITTGCVTLTPFTMTLIPGSRAPSDSTRIVISAQRGGTDRIDDAALFSFTPGESLRLDFVLYANCLDKIDCKDINQACGPDRQCAPVRVNPFNGEPDLAQPRGGSPGDMGGGGSGGSDLASSPGDMELDMSGPCVPYCPPNFCGMSNCNTMCGCGSGAMCMSNTCVPCGEVNDECCLGQVCHGNAVCGTNGTCECGGLHQPCCAPDDTCNDLSLGCVLVGQNMQCETVDMGTPPPPNALLQTWDKQVFTGTPPAAFDGVSGAGSFVVAVGPAGNIWQRTTVNTFTRMHSSGAGDVSGDFSRVWISAPNHGWAVGKGGLVDYWDGTTWTVDAFSAKMAYDLDGVWANGSDAWVSGLNAGGGIVAHNVGGMWLTASNATPFGGVWSDGSAGALLCYTGDSDFVASDNGTAISLTEKTSALSGAVSKKVWGDALSEAWLVTRGGDVIFYNGALMPDLPAQANIAFNAITGFGSGAAVELWAAGQDTSTGQAVLFHARGLPGTRSGADNWIQQTVPMGTNATFNDVVALAPRDLYLAGSDAGTALVYHAHTP